MGDLPRRIGRVLILWLAQGRHPRYLLAGVLHIVLFLGFLALALRSTQLVALGFLDGLPSPAAYGAIKDVASTAVALCVVVLAVRRAVFKPARYAVPPEMGKDHGAEALLILGLILTLMVSEGLFEASRLAALGLSATPFTLTAALRALLAGLGHPALRAIHLAAYTAHDLTFFGFLCLLPLGKHFHVVTSLFNILFMRLEPGTVKPVRHGVDAAGLDALGSFGVKRFEDFTWKHMLDFYSCADCGRCTDRCPANAAGRPLSPRFISIKARDYAFAHYPLLGRGPAPEPLVGGIFSPEEIWACTTCGACEEECPIGIEYLDKIVDLRRGLVEDGQVPQGIQKALAALEKRGNPWAKPERARAAWTGEAGVPVKLAEEAQAPDLYFVDSFSSYDERSQRIAQATARLLTRVGLDFAVLGKEERDSGHEVRRFGEEMLFQSLKDHNTEAIAASGATRLVASDPHAYNALRHDYEGLPPVRHVSEVLAEGLREGRLRPAPLADPSRTYTYHDPCYLGRHNGVYDAPREALDAIPGLKRVEMENACRDRSFCCGGGGLNLFHEARETKRMGVLRVEQARKAGADVLVTACPYCLANLEDAVKVAGLEGRMEVIDLCELVDGQLRS
jgi:Fe-S oxidoreductase